MAGVKMTFSKFLWFFKICGWKTVTKSTCIDKVTTRGIKNASIDFLHCTLIFNINSHKVTKRFPHGGRHFRKKISIGLQNPPCIFWKCLPSWGNLFVTWWELMLTKQIWMSSSFYLSWTTRLRNLTLILETRA